MNRTGELLGRYVDFLFAFNQKVNLVSRQMPRAQFEILLKESLLVADTFTADLVVDVGSGNGLLGIPLAIAMPQKKIILMETVKKKGSFLKEVVGHLELTNVTIDDRPIQEYMRGQSSGRVCLVSRGFPRNDLLYRYLCRGKISELVLITSADKIEKVQEKMENVKQSLYNIPWRSNLKIIKWEYVSRETLNHE